MFNDGQLNYEYRRICEKCYPLQLILERSPSVYGHVTQNLSHL